MKVSHAAIIAISIAIIYSIIFYVVQPDDIWTWINTLAGTWLSFFLALLGGLWLFNKQKTTSDSSKKKDLESLLSAEFSDLLRILSDDSRLRLSFPNGSDLQVLIAFIQPLAIEKSALSGLFSRVASENLLHLARKIRMLNLKTEFLLTIIAGNPDEQRVRHAATNIEETRASITRSVRQAARHMNIDIHEDYPD